MDVFIQNKKEKEGEKMRESEQRKILRSPEELKKVALLDAKEYLKKVQEEIRILEDYYSVTKYKLRLKEHEKIQEELNRLNYLQYSKKTARYYESPMIEKLRDQYHISISSLEISLPTLLVRGLLQAKEEKQEGMTYAELSAYRDFVQKKLQVDHSFEDDIKTKISIFNADIYLSPTYYSIDWIDQTRLYYSIQGGSLLKEIVKINNATLPSDQMNLTFDKNANLEMLMQKYAYNEQTSQRERYAFEEGKQFIKRRKDSMGSF